MTIALNIDLDRATPAGLLSAFATEHELKRHSEIREMLLALEWAAMHPTDSIYDAMTVPGTQHELAVAGEGAPLVAEFAVAELATALGRTADSARMWLGTVLEARYRLPKVWTRMVNGPLEPYRVRMIAERTMLLSPDAAAWVDAQVAQVAHKIGPVRLARLIDDAIRRFDPDEAIAKELAAAERRKVEVYTRDVAAGGVVDIAATLDAVDARDVDAALARAAHQLLLDGSDAPLDVRRALALGEIARRELALDLVTGEITATASSATLYLHMSAADMTDARVEKGSSDYPVAAERLREWLTRPGTTVMIRPVVDLATEAASKGYQPSPRLREQVILKNRTCVFPFCTRAARTADLDHIHPWEQGGKTTTSNLAPLCRLHHRVKTHGRWNYIQLSPGEFRWRSPHGQSFHVDPTGTAPLGTRGRVSRAGPQHAAARRAHRRPRPGPRQRPAAHGTASRPRSSWPWIAGR